MGTADHKLCTYCALANSLGSSCAGGTCGTWSWTACVTSTGNGTRGGALFIDLPANMLACFILGVLTPTSGLRSTHDSAQSKDGAPQRHASPLQTGLRVGFCGSLSTFASWCALRDLLLFVRLSCLQVEAQRQRTLLS